MSALPADGPDPLGYEHARLPSDLAALEAAFAAALGDAASVAVAYSGGVDSSVALALCARALGRERVLAVLGVSPSLAASERSQARVTAHALGVECREVPTFELDDPDYVANRGDRCYFCKAELYTRVFADGVAAFALDLVVNGDHADDLRAPDRPGRRAAAELGVGSPLAAAGIGKREVRALARALDLPVWDKPSAPCLASRVPVGTPVTRERLALVEQAEAALRDLGLRHLRVRHLGERARLELGPDERARLADPALRARVVGAVRAAGYADVQVAERPLDRS